jgi:uncharacterized protein YjbJ (UPF0337 family)
MSDATISSPDANSPIPASIPSADAMKGRWQQKLGEAKLAWGRLTHDELLQLEGHAEKLTGLVQERYALTRDAAAKQVKTFYDKHFS